MKQPIKIFFFIFAAIILVSCENEEPNVKTISGNSILTSRIEDGKVHGFSFKESGVVELNMNNNVDFTVSTLTSETGTPFGSLLSSPEFDTEFASLEPMEMKIESDEFESLESIPDFVDNWANTASIKTGDIWFVKTRENKYAKLHFTDVSEITDNEGNYSFSSISFAWVYQPDGTTNF
jgi:hypothetical protein